MMLQISVICCQRGGPCAIVLKVRPHVHVGPSSLVFCLRFVRYARNPLFINLFHHSLFLVFKCSTCTIFGQQLSYSMDQTAKCNLLKRDVRQRRLWWNQAMAKWSCNCFTKYQFAWLLLPDTYPSFLTMTDAYWTRDTALTFQYIGRLYQNNGSDEWLTLFEGYASETKVLQHLDTLSGNFTTGGIGEPK